MQRVVVLALALALPRFAPRPVSQTDSWTKVFPVQRADLRSTGRSPFFVLEPGYAAVFDGGDEHLVITVLRWTRMVDGVETRVVEERETKGGKLVEVSRNYFAIHASTGDVYYFGEDVDMYRDGRVVNHKGSWLAGVKSARFGLMMPGRPKVGVRHYQEVAAGQALDRAEVVSMSDVVTTPAGTFRNCVKVEETTPLEPGSKEYKYYAAGIGLVQDGGLKLVKYGPR